MERINDPTAEADKFGAGKDGFTEGDPGLVARTIVRAAWLDGVQEEIVTTIEGAGLTPSAGNLSQLLAAIAALHNFAYCTVTASSHAVSTDFDLSSLVQRGGFALATDTIDIPAAGNYLIAVRLQLTSSDTGNPASIQAVVVDGITTLIGTGTQMRFSANNGDTVTVCAIGVKSLSASSAISVQAAAGLSPHTFSGSGDLFVMRLS